MGFTTGRKPIALLLALAVSTSFLWAGVQGGRHHHHAKHTRRNSARPPSAHAPGPASGRRHAPPHVSPPAPPPSSSSSGGYYPTPGAAPEPAPAPAAGAGTVYDVVKDFGAVGDGVADDTDAVKTAWDTACQDEGASVVLAAAGYSFLVHSTVFTGPCQGSVTIQVGGTVLGTG